MARTGLLRPAVPPLAALAALVLAASGCGSTISATTTGAGAQGAQGLSGPNALGPSGAPSSAGSVGLTATGPGSNGAPGTSTASALGSGGAGGPGNPGSSAGTGNGGTGGPGPVSTSTAGEGPGVTPTTINIAANYDPNAGAEDAALGAGGANPGNTMAEENAAIAYINSHGGVAHRKVVPIWFKASVTQNATTTESQECAYWTQDHKTFVLMSGAPILDQCTKNAHAIAVDAGAITLETTATNEQYPADINLTGLSNDRAMRLTIEGLARQGYFSHGAKVGIATWDDPYFTYSISHAAVPALAALGVHNVPVAYIASPQSYGDLGATSSSTANAVLKFRGMGINHVILFDGGSGVNSAGILVLEWMNQAQSQHYNPTYGLNSTSGLSTLAPDLPAQQMVGSLGVGWLPPLDELSSDYPESQFPPAAKVCVKIMNQAGQPASGGSQATLALAICDQLFFLKQVLDPITGPLNQSTAMAATNAIGTNYRPEITFGTYLSSSRHDGVDLVRNVAFYASCTCYRYTSPAYAPGG